MAGRNTIRYSLPNSEGSITRSELRRANKDKQIDIMRQWFHENYTDPTENTPYESSEGGFIYIWGGPYDPKEELADEFGGVARDKAIAALVNELRDITCEWTGNPNEQGVDDYVIDAIEDSVPASAYRTSISNVERMLDIRVDLVAEQTLFRLLYANVITALETYLSDFFISKISGEPALLRRFVEKNKDFQSEKISVSEIFEVHEGIERKVKIHLTGLVWHKLEKVRTLFIETLQIKFPSDLGKLFRAILVRHDIVHRNGKTPEGFEHSFTRSQISELIADVNQFVNYIEWGPQLFEELVDG